MQELGAAHTLLSHHHLQKALLCSTAFLKGSGRYKHVFEAAEVPRNYPGFSLGETWWKAEVLPMKTEEIPALLAAVVPWYHHS